MKFDDASAGCTATKEGGCEEWAQARNCGSRNGMVTDPFASLFAAGIARLPLWGNGSVGTCKWDIVSFVALATPGQDWHLRHLDTLTRYTVLS